MTDNELILQDRLEKIKQTIEKYGEENFYISFSGGKDSTVLSALIDMALPENKIPRVYANTGIELNMIRDFVLEMQKIDNRIEVIKPSVPIKKMLEEEGYPFKSKHHSEMLKIYQRNPYAQSSIKYKNGEYNFNSNKCPKCLRYQFEPTFNLKVSDECCDKLKKEPLLKWQKENNKPFGIVGIMPAEGGRRATTKCLTFKNNGKVLSFHPLVPVTKEWEDWFISEYNIQICDIYKPPYNLIRTGCKGCPFAINLQQELDTLEKYFPAERKQCESIWKPVYDEYRRIGYRLKPLDEHHQISIDEYEVESEG